MLVAQQEDNPQFLIHDKFAVALANSDYCGSSSKVYVEAVAHFFIYHAGHISCEVTGSKRYSTALAGLSGDFCPNELS